jgi:hypothetical protein
LFRGGGSGPQVKSLKLADYANTGSSAHFTIDGPVVAQQNHERIEIDVDADQVTLSIYKSYGSEQIAEQTYLNTQTAYTTFLKALQGQGFTNVNTNPALKDERGVCPLNTRNIYAFDDGSKQVLRAWSTGCGSKTFMGNISPVRTLFQRQVPDYSAQVRAANLDTI